MDGPRIRKARKELGLTQQQLARKIGCSQTYLSLIENGRRNVPAGMRRKLVQTLALPVTLLPVRPGATRRDDSGEWFRRRLGELGYPGFRYLATRLRPSVNPVEVLMGALAEQRSDPRVFEALPWLLLRFGEFDRDSLVEQARNFNVQNRLGFVASLALAIAESVPGHGDRVNGLRGLVEALEPYRLACTDDLGQGFRTERYREFVHASRSADAKHWNLLTTLGSQDVSRVS